MQTLAHRVCWRAFIAFCLIAMSVKTSHAKVVRIVIDKNKSESPAYGGRSFGSVGQYEKIAGRAYGELDPKDRRNAIIQDIALAPRNAHGMVEYVASFTLLKPVDASKEDGVMLFDVVNRGNRQMVRTFNGGDPGGGFLMKQGVVILSSGWQGDIVPAGPNDERETIQVPVATNTNGSPVAGPVLMRWANIPARHVYRFIGCRRP